MSELSRTLVVAAPRIAEAARYAFEAEGARVSVVSAEEAGREIARARCDLVVAGPSAASLEAVRGAIRDSGAPLPILYVGAEVGREEAESAGAAVLRPPVFVRDLATAGKLIAGESLLGGLECSGELEDHFGVYYLVRALVELEVTGILSVGRGFRRGELRLCRGEVTSAKVGVLHGLAALHQLLLWADGHIDLRPHEAVRRGQIPLARHELLENCARFLIEMHDVARGLSPAAVYVRDPDGGAGEGGLPEEALAVLRMFDGERTVADVAEDSPYRVTETLRMARRLANLGLIHSEDSDAAAPRAWLVGIESGREDGTDSDRWSHMIPAAGEEDLAAGLCTVVPASAAAGEFEARAAQSTETEMATDTADPAPEQEAADPAAEAEAEAADGPAANTPGSVDPRERALASSAAAVVADTTAAADEVATFTARDEDFFDRGHELSKRPAVPTESFEDLESAAPEPRPSLVHRLLRLFARGPRR